MRFLIATLALATAACSSGGSTSPPDAGATPGGSSTAAATQPAPQAASRRPAPVRQGGTIARAVTDDALYVADEDHGVLRIVPLPLAPDRPGLAVTLPGPPAQVLPLDGRVLVTIRDPGLLLVLRPDPAAGLVEAARVALPLDAWGIAITPDEKTALVSSAWTAQVSAVDLDALKVTWTVPVAREPRGIAILPDGSAAYVSHLVGADLTRLDGLASAPTPRRVALAASPLRAPSGVHLAASLGYALALSDDGRRLFAARHALGAMGHAAWFGAATVDVMVPGRDEAVAPLHQGGLPVLKSAFAEQVLTPDSVITVPGATVTPFTQPRAIVYRRSARTLLVAAEGDDLVAELDAVAVDPSIAVVRTYKVGSQYDPHFRVAGSCGAPAGLALSANEDTAWVFCRATYDIAALRLGSGDPPVPQRDPATGAPKATPLAPTVPSAPPALVAPPPPPEEKPFALVHLANDPHDPEVAVGRRLFYSATDAVTSGNLACAGCHPEGRDDGYVWHEAAFDTADGEHTNFVGRPELMPPSAKKKGYPRRTPMLAGNVSAPGPYGWHGESEDLPARLKAGFGLHRWGGLPQGHDPNGLVARSHHLSVFLRKGLVPPPRADGAPDARVRRGQEIFISKEARCSSCHVPETGYTDRTAYPMPKRSSPGFDDDPRQEFKTPSLRFVAGRAPYLHDGRHRSLTDLIERNADWMGKTSHLSPDDRAALVAFLETL
ncbi:hypothetical protein [Chondromyces apiculatus]|uniref:Cytochrome c domain-containing protein n=1 Tax=Chondromyces apiculatus DSM 436 TaxID=1192034 RepID=A0A017T3C4_9BACT|nr:hypothetical protein [Chondromyces apiculatus]EYF03754.1 Hypothetical protein CAP_5184 [Chondromyces apiculatus DSM 436]